MSKRKPIQGVVASILNIIIVLIILDVIYIWAKAHNEGRDLNITEVVVQETRQFYDDVITGWNSSEKDTIK